MVDLLTYAQDLSEAGEYEEAYILADKHLKNDPNNPHWLNVMTYLMLQTEKPSIAYQLAKRVCDMVPRDSTGWLNLGMACRDMRLDTEAIRHFKRSLKFSVDPEKAAMASINISSSLIDMGEFKKAEAYCLKAIELNPESKKGVMNLGFAQLGQRNWKEGWANYREVIGHDWRPRFQYNDEPLWDGKSKGTIVLYGEQGLGDQISFMSVLPDALEWAKENDSRIIVECDPRLESLCKRSFPDLTVYGTLGRKGVSWDESDRQVDYSLPIGQACEYFRNSDSDFPGTEYLVPDADRLLQWEALFESKKKPVIGIAWSSGTFKTGSKFRRVGLEELLPVLESVDAHWVSLQYKPASREIAKFKEKHPEIDIVEYKHGTLSGDYDDTLAMVSALDMVFCMHTTVTHVAGGLGIPCWTLVPKNSQWRYGEDETYVWADSVKLLRQTQHGKWKDVIKKSAEDLRVRFDPKSRAA